jgi:PAS domain S-box-containing protein
MGGSVPNEPLKLPQTQRGNGSATVLILEGPRASSNEIQRILQAAGYQVKNAQGEATKGGSQAPPPELVVLQAPAAAAMESDSPHSSSQLWADRFRTLADNISQLAWMADERGSIFWFNKRWFEYTGATLQETQGWGWKRIHHPEYVESVEKQFRASIAGGQPWEDTFPLRGRDGKYRWFLSRAMPIRDEQGKILWWFGTHTDITAQKHIEEELQRQAALIDLTPTAMLVRALDGTIHFWNRGSELLYGWKRQEALGRSTHELLQTQFPEPPENIISALKREGRWSGDLRHRARDGRWLVIESWWLAKRSSTGEIIEILESNIDVTERKRLQGELEQLVTERTARLRETIADLEHFSYTITHDMRAPLRAMQTFGQILQSEYADRLDDSGRDYLERIIHSSQRMDLLITDALSYAKIVKQEMDLEPVDIETLLRGMISSYPEFQMPNAMVVLEDGIPCVLGNKAGLTQCFSNLLGNAVKVVAPGVRPRVRVWGEAAGEFVRIWVEDNGIGISTEGQKKIFTMFQRLSKKHEGTGIGLALVQKVVERMGGKVGVESETGKGSRFWIDVKKVPAAPN